MRIILSLALGLVGLGLSAQTVTSTADSGPGSLRNAIQSSSPNGNIQFDASLVSNGYLEIALDSAITIPHALTIDGSLSGTDTVLITGVNSTNGLLRMKGTASNPVDLTVNYVKMSNSTASDSGSSGAIYIRGNVNSVEVNHSVFTHCSTITYTNYQNLGGAISIRGQFGGSAAFSEVIFKQCSTNYDTAAVLTYAGALYLGEIESVLVQDCEFKENTSRWWGGAIRLNSISNEVVFKRSLFEGNECYGTASVNNPGGGALALRNTNRLIVDSCEFLDNRAYIDQILPPSGGSAVIQTMFGGAIQSEGHAVSNEPDTLFISNTLFSGSSATHGGTFNVFGNRIIMFNSSILNSQAERGAAILMNFQDSGEALFMERSTVYNAITTAPGMNIVRAAVIIPDPASARILNSTFAANDGQEVFFPSTGTLSLKGSVLQGGVSQGNLPSGTVLSQGYNAFGLSYAWLQSTDITGASFASMDLSSPRTLNNNVPCLLPGPASILLNLGDPNDTSRTQSGSIIGIREIGSAEAARTEVDSAVLCGTSFVWLGDTITSAGIYSDTVNVQGVPSYHTLYLFDNHVDAVQDFDQLHASPALHFVTYTWIDCDTDVEVGVGETFTPTQNGNYAVIMTSDFCADTSDCIAVNDVSTIELDSPELTLYPNPTSGQFTLEGLEETTSVQIIDMQGRVVKTLEYREGNISVEELKGGLYLVRLRTNDEVQTLRLVKL